MPSPGIIRLQRSIWDFLQPTADALCIYGAMWLVNMLARGYVEVAAHFVAVTAVVVFLLAGQLTGLHRRWSTLTSNQEFLSIVGTWLLTLVTLAMIGFVTRYTEVFARSVLVTWAVLAPTGIGLARMLLLVTREYFLKNGIGVRRVGIAGMNTLGVQIAENIRAEPGLGLSLYGFFDDRGRLRNTEQPEDLLELSGSLRDLVDAAINHQVDIVMITLPMRAESRIRFVLDQLSNSTVSVYIVPDFFVFELLHSRWTSVGGLPAVSVFENPLYGVDGALKRAVDVGLSLCGLLVAGLPMLVIALAVKLTSAGPVFFRQRRYGLDGQEIRVWKFRSMRVCDDGGTVKQATKGDPRVTRLGAFLRRTSLDELPQLFNVLEGSMSLVGPRPHANAHNEQYRGLIRGYMLRHKVKPGITGLAQVSGCRGETDTIDKMQRRVEWDHRYIRQWSIWLDLKILTKTLLVAWRQPEAY
ncbi:undecaprenyl-phosphate glucose phosphotransferase [Planctomycetaceae bacterium SH139]